MWGRDLSFVERIDCLELTIALPQGEERVAVTGIGKRNLKIIRESLGVNITSRNDALKISGDSERVGQAAHAVEQLGKHARRNKPLGRTDVLRVVTEASNRATGGATAGSPVDPEQAELDVYLAGRTVAARSEGQRNYLTNILRNDLTICTGPAGTGKTYLAVAAACTLLKHGQTRKLVLVRPAVEAGERLGFLPGDMQEKVNPYLRPLLDALQSMMEFDQVQRFLANGLIEVVPLAFMRGRTLNDAVIILDEAQNATRSQMLMFLTRLGNASKMIVTGDPSQIDLADISDSGLIDAIRRLQRVRGVATVALGAQDIVRHDLVQRIVAAYHPDGNEQRQPVTDPTPYV